MPIERAAIVDPYSSGAMLAPELAKMGCRCVAVQSAADVPPLFRSSFHPADFTEIIVHEGDCAATAAKLRELKVQALLPGSEMGVELADQLCDRLGLPSNGIGHSKARRDKFLMSEAVRAAGLRTPQQVCSGELPEILTWTRSHGRWPVIVKPVAACASDGVQSCAGEAEVQSAFQQIVGRRNMLGLVNEAALAQEFLSGSEYVVDTVSCEGRHRVTAFWKYHKPQNSSSFVSYDAMELLAYDGDVQEKLRAYATAALDALEIRIGPAHCELMWVDDQPVLMEIGARLSAGNNATLSRTCGGVCALDLTIAAYLDPRGFAAGIESHPKLKLAAANFFLIPGKTGRLKSLPRVDEIRALRSFQRMSIGAKVGEPLGRVAGAVTLVHPDRAVILEEIQALRELQDHGFYEVGP
jgi:biotin carboxylase